MEQAKIRPSVTLYSLDRSLPNLVGLIMSATPTHMQILVEFGLVLSRMLLSLCEENAFTSICVH